MGSSHTSRSQKCCVMCRRITKKCDALQEFVAHYKKLVPVANLLVPVTHQLVPETQSKNNVLPWSCCLGNLVVMTLALNVRDPGLIPRWGTELFGLLELTVIFGAQLLDSWSNCLVKVWGHIFPGGGGECHVDSCLGGLAVMRLTRNARECKFDSPLRHRIFRSVRTHCYTNFVSFWKTQLISCHVNHDTGRTRLIRKRLFRTGLIRTQLIRIRLIRKRLIRSSTRLKSSQAFL